MRRFRHLTKSDRLKIEALSLAKVKVKDIAEQIGVHYTTIYDELKRGRYIHLNSDYTEEVRYSADLAEAKYQENLRNKGPELKIGNDYLLADYIEDKICNEGYSPGAVLGEIKSKNIKFKTTISKTTLYSYIDKGIFLTVTNKSLPVKCRKRKKYKKVRVHKRVAAGDSIEKRPNYIDNRQEFGHWEMDTVVGKRGKSQHSLLVLTERKTRKEIIRILTDYTADCVVNKLNEIEQEFGLSFRSIFKTITVDNGKEFSDNKGLETSIFCNTENRTKIYYCHPYSSWERGSNENQNKLIRRKIFKGMNFDDKTDEDIKKIEDWINNYPRELFGWMTANDMYYLELGKT